MTHTITVRIDYFKPTGKWYSEGSFEIELETLGPHHINTLPVPTKIKEMRERGERPGLTDNRNCEFVWVVRVLFEGDIYVQYLYQPKGLEQAAERFWRGT
jgi:hypothetical protein